MKRFQLALAVALALLTVPPAARAQEAGPLYFPATGHTLDDAAGFLSFWRGHDGARLLGLPVTEAAGDDGAAVQYFERGRLEQRGGAVAVGPVAEEYAQALYRSFPAAPPQPGQAGVRSFPATGHTLRAPFLAFWQAAGGEAILGAPISEPLWEATGAGRRQVQYFRNVRLERDASVAGSADEIVVSDLGRALAALRGLDTDPVDNPGYEVSGPAAAPAPDVGQFAPRPTPAPTAVPAPEAPPAQAPAQRAPAAGDFSKRILVNLSDQWLYAYEGDRLVFDAPVATGRDGMETPTGTFAIYAKLKIQTMDGVLDGKPWVVPNVPNVMYIHGGVALHGTYWHNLFGTGARPSHGCVNLPLKAAAWLYDWAPVGTPVRVIY